MKDKSINFTQYHSKYYAEILTLQNSANSIDRLSQSIFNAQIDLNPHQVEVNRARVQEIDVWRII